MILKTADDKSKRLALLEELQRAEVLDLRQKKWARDEFFRTKKGVEGEKEAAYFLDQYFKGAENHVLLHDLRFVVDGDVVQIDHLVINRGLGMYLIETKNYAGNVSINGQGEFTVEYDSDRFGVPSPIEQSRRHARILGRLLERLGIGSRTGAPLEFYHLVMFHPKAIIQRPPAKAFDTSNVIKADQFPSWHSRFVEDELGVAKILRMTMNVRAVETIKEWGERLKSQHKPANLLELPEFMRAKVPVAPKVAPSPVVVPRMPPAVASVAVAGGTPKPSDAEQPAKKLICLKCNAKISYAEGKFCWNNAARFDGGQYCREHQALF